MLYTSANIVLDKLKSYITKHQLFDKSDQLALAISGGKDSVCAAYLLNALRIPFLMVHVNFNLRGTESNQDEQFVRNLSSALQFCTDVSILSVDTEEVAAEKKISIQEAAREIRYAYFSQLYSDGAFTKIITAHHQTDSLETFFINLYRKSGIAGLSGISISRNFIIRPLMCFSSLEIASYIAQNKIEYRDDSSNKQNKYLRNKIRNTIVPNIVEHLPDFESRSIESIDILKQENESLKFLLSNFSKSITKWSNGTLKIQKKPVLSFPQPTVLLYHILDKYGFNPSQCKQIGVLSEKVIGRVFESNTHRALVDRDFIFVSKLESFKPTSVLIPEPGTYAYNSGKFVISKLSKANFSEDKLVECVHLPKDLFPLTLRCWQKGDRIQPLGMKGSKLVSDFFIDEKINLTDKEKTPLLCSNDEVIWIVGHRISEKIKIDKLDDIHQLSFTFE